MAKTSVPNTAGSQFFIVSPGSTPSHLDGDFTVFGSVYSGFSIVDYIDAVQTGGSQGTTPLNDIKIVNAYPVEINDLDMDGIQDNQDNCPEASNPNQTDTDEDGTGDVCDSDLDGDGVDNDDDDFPNDNSEHTDTDGDRTIVVWDENGNVVQSQSFYIQSTNGGSDPTTVPLNFNLPVGNNFVIGTDTAVNNQNFGNNNPMLKRQGDQYYGYCNYPYVIDNVVELKNSPYGTDWYYYFYNWDVEPVACESPLVPFEITVVTCASVDENVLTVQIYPNPTTSFITIDGVSNGVYTLTNVLGESVVSGKLTEGTTVSLEKLAKGVYTIVIESENKKYTDKIVVQ